MADAPAALAGGDLKALNALKAACVFIKSPDNSTGSGYLIAPGIAATAWHVVRNWTPGQRYDVMVGVGDARRACKATLLERDEAADAATLSVEGAEGVPPLPVAAPLTRRAAWEGYGFPGLAHKADAPPPQGLSMMGHVQDPATRNDANQPAVLLYSDAIAAGQASPLHGFSGSPIVVEGALIGHLVKHLGDPDDRRRAAYGYAYACPISVVTALLDKPPAPLAIAPAALPTVRESVPAVGEDEYHVFVSYRSTDRPFAMSLVARLEGAGLKVFIDQKELEAGQYLGKQLEQGMKRSKSAVVLVSKGWLSSPWCELESQVLVTRATEDKVFTLVPLKLDDCELPPLLGARLWFNFSGKPAPDGPPLEQLVRTLAQRTGVAPPAAQAARAAQARVTDEFVARIRSAARGHVAEVLKVLAEWRLTRADDAAPLIAGAEVLIAKGRFEDALAQLAEAPRSLRTRQLAALANRKKGDIDPAIQELEALQREGALDPETAGLLAGSYKARWKESNELAFRQLSYETYRKAYAQFQDPFNGINAAAMAQVCGDTGSVIAIAAALVASLLKQADTLNHWGLASLGEAYLLIGSLDEARKWYTKAAAQAAGRHQDIAVMRAQARMNLEAQGKPRDGLDAVLPVPRVLAYAGHRVDAADRPQPRFPASKVQAVRHAIQGKLAQLGNVHGFGGAASGTDLMVLGELAAKGLTATVVLPFPAAAFAEVSVGGKPWRRTFDEMQAKPGIEFAPPILPARPEEAKLAEAFDDANVQIQKLAMDYAKRLDEKPLLLAVWDGQPGDGPGGTADTVAQWRFEGIEPVIIDLRGL